MAERISTECSICGWSLSWGLPECCGIEETSAACDAAEFATRQHLASRVHEWATIQLSESAGNGERRSGRTYRMLERARAAQNTSDMTIILVHTSHDRIAMWHAAKSLGLYMPCVLLIALGDAARLAGFRPSGVFVDHSVFEFPHPAKLATFEALCALESTRA